MEKQSIFNTGELVDRRFRVIEMIGGGGMGEIYEVVDTELDDRVALKVIKGGLGLPEAFERFQDEIRLARQITHPNICRIHDFGLHRTGGDERLPFFTMELLAGTTLRSLVGGGRRWNAEQTQELLEGLVAGLEAAHRRGIVHRDFKSGNIMVVRETSAPKPRVVITDFGLAHWMHRAEARRTRAGVVVGTPAYMAPEQARGAEPTPAMDVFALGVVLYETLTGELPFGRSGCRNPKRTAPRSPCDLVPDLDRAWGRVVLQCLAGNPEDRFHEVRGVLDTLIGELGETWVQPQDLRDRVLILHDGSASTVVARLADWLEGQGLDVDGGRWNQDVWALERLLLRSRRVLICVGRAGGGPWEREGVEASLEGCCRHRGLEVVPVLLPGANLPRSGRLPGFVRHLAWVDLRSGSPAVFPQVLRPPGAGVLEAATEQNPFRGLQSFEEEHHHLFFGRDAFVQRLYEEMRHGRFLALVGPSGSGKSSVLGAGLIPALRRGALPDSGDWTLDQLRPWDRPLEQLALVLRRLAPSEGSGDDPAEVARRLEAEVETLRTNPKTLHFRLRIAAEARPDPWRLVLIVDPFEELFTQCSDLEERRAFFENLLNATAFGDSRLQVVIALRADFYREALDHSDLAAALERQVAIPRMTDWELRTVIEGPAQMAGLELQDGLVDALLADLDETSSPLPLLQHTLDGLWQRRVEGRLTLDAYRTLGGALGAISQHADTVFEAQLTPRQRELARHLFTGLVVIGEGVDGARRRRPRREILPQSAAQGEVDEVLEVLTRERLLTRDRDALTGEEMVEIVHEALIRNWSRLQDWLDTSREILLVRESLLRRARDWDRRWQRSGEALLSAAEARRYQALRDAPQVDLGALEVEYLEASQRALALRALGRRRRRLRQAAVLLVSMLLAVFGLWGWLRFEEHQGLEADLRSGDPGRALPAFHELMSGFDESPATLTESLAATLPAGGWIALLDGGLSSILGESRESMLLGLAEGMATLDPPPSSSEVSALVWALDYYPGRESRWHDRYQESRRGLGVLLGSSSPQDLPWVTLDPADCGVAELDRFVMLRHELTNEELALFDSDAVWELEDPRRPADVDWYQSYAIAVWLGGRLATEAEWRFATTGCCPRDTECERRSLDGIESRAWFSGSDWPDGVPTLMPVEGLAANDLGLFDLHGNAREWILAWEGSSDDPWGPPDGSRKRLLGGWILSSEKALGQSQSLEPWNRGRTAVRVVIPQSSEEP